MYTPKRLFNSTLLLLVLSITLQYCSQPVAETPPAAPINENFEITTMEYANMAEQALARLINLDIEGWSEMLADDAEYYFPDGDAGTRTKLTGKTEVVAWWKKWRETSGIEKMTIKNGVHIPIVAKKTLKYTGLTGEIVLSYFSNEMTYDGVVVRVRMHFAAHFNKAKKIDRYYTYYDRTPIINAVKYNILDPETVTVDP